MHKFPFLYSANKIPLIFENLKQYKVIDRLTYRKLAPIGFSSSKDRPILPFLVSLDLLDQSGAPTQNYFFIKDTRLLKKFLNDKIKELYREIFESKNYVPNVSEDTLAGIFMEKSMQTPGTCLIYAKTMMALIAYCGFSLEQKQDVKVSLSEKSFTPKINISINLPTTTDDAVYEKVFRHLKDLLSR